MNNEVRVASRLCMTKDLGQYGNLFGGNMMAWIDEAAAIFAIRTCGEKNMVTLHYSAMTFRHPVREGDIVEFFCSKVRRGVTSITFEIKALCGTEMVFCADCVFVAVDDNGRKKPIAWKQAN